MASALIHQNDFNIFSTPKGKISLKGSLKIRQSESRQINVHEEKVHTPTRGGYIISFKKIIKQYVPSQEVLSAMATV